MMVSGYGKVSRGKENTEKQNKEEGGTRALIPTDVQGPSDLKLSAEQES